MEIPDPEIEPEQEGDPGAAAVLRRIRWNSVAAYLGFAVFTAIFSGFRGLIGLTCSAAVAMISFLWLEEIADAILQPSALLHPRRLTVRAIARFLLLGVALLVTIVVARFNPLTVLLGFSIVVVGIIGEAVYSAFKSVFSRTD